MRSVKVVLVVSECRCYCAVYMRHTARNTVFHQYEENPFLFYVNVGLSHVTGKDRRDKAVGVALCFYRDHELPGEPASPAVGVLVGNADKTLFS